MSPMRTYLRVRDWGENMELDVTNQEGDKRTTVGNLPSPIKAS